MDIKNFVARNWKNAEALSTLLGTECNRTEEFCFGSFPTEKAKIEVTDGKISRVTTWSGAWSDEPIVDIRDLSPLTLEIQWLDAENEKSLNPQTTRELNEEENVIFSYTGLVRIKRGKE